MNLPKVLRENCCPKLILTLPQSNRERETIRYAVYKASGVTPNQAHKHFGFDNISSRALEVEKCIAETQEIRAAIDDLAYTQDKALLATYGIVDVDDSSTSETESSDEFEYPREDDAQELKISNDFLMETLKSCDCNWLELVSCD